MKPLAAAAALAGVGLLSLEVFGLVRLRDTRQDLEDARQRLDSLTQQLTELRATLDAQAEPRSAGPGEGRRAFGMADGMDGDDGRGLRGPAGFPPRGRLSEGRASDPSGGDALPRAGSGGQGGGPGAGGRDPREMQRQRAQVLAQVVDTFASAHGLDASKKARALQILEEMAEARARERRAAREAGGSPGGPRTPEDTQALVSLLGSDLARQLLAARDQAIQGSRGDSGPGGGGGAGRRGGRGPRG